MHTVTLCPLCFQEFAYHTLDKDRLSRTIFMMSEITTITICQECDDKDRDDGHEGSLSIASSILKQISTPLEDVCDKEQE